MKKILLYFLLILPVVLQAQIPDGYYNAAQGKTGAALKTALFNIIHTHTERTYTQLWTDFQSTDKKANGKVWDIYSDVPGGNPDYEYTFISDQCGNYSGEGSCYNREHSFPKSWFNDAEPMYTDLFHIYPTDGYVNGKRGNYPYGEVTSPNWTSTNGSKLGPSATAGYTGTVFEPIDEYKGDLARTYFYMVTCYENVVTQWNSDVLSGDTYPAFSQWTLTLLLKWNDEDPVSQKEIDRNNAIYSIQHNRNPYIDHPEYVDEVWGTASAVPNKQELSVSAYPNPAHRTIHVQNGLLHSASYTLYNEMGQVISRGTLDNGTNGIDISNFTKGLLLLRINDPQSHRTKQYKILKM
ncbi:MAG: endonuclease [Bacteroidales bacterium]|nr:endonuclease [Bacteroidales bacterium]